MVSADNVTDQALVTAQQKLAAANQKKADAEQEIAQLNAVVDDLQELPLGTSAE